MLQIQKLVNFLNEKLSNDSYSFDIKAQVGETQDNGKVQGILYTVDAPTKLKVKEVNYTFVCELVIPTARTNANYIEIENIVGEFVKEYDGSSHKFGKIAKNECVLQFTLGKPENFETKFEIGNATPMYLTIKALYTEGAVTSANKHWLLEVNDSDGFLEIPFHDERVLLNKNGLTRNINDKERTNTFMTGQTKQYKFVFPYVDGVLCNTLQKDILVGDFKKIYTLKYYDGREFTEESPFVAKVSLFANADSGDKVLETGMFNVSFTDVDDGNTEVKYWLGLIDNPFDNQAEDTMWFDSQSEQQEYFETQVSAGAEFVQIKAPNLNSLDITSQVYENENIELFDLVNKNYAVIKVEKGTAGQTGHSVKYFYYFVTNAQIGADKQVMFDLKLDTIQTYLFNPNIEFSDCYIEKACLNRWVEDIDPTKVKFDGRVESKLFEREDLQNLPKRITKRTRINICNTGDATFDNWINNHIYAWLYVYVDTQHVFQNFESFDGRNFNSNLAGSLQYISKDSVNGIPSNISCFFVPLYKEDNVFYNKYLGVKLEENNVIKYCQRLALDYFAQNNQGYAQIYSVKVSYVSPFYIAPSYQIVNDNLLLLSDSTTESNTAIDYNGLTEAYGTHASASSQSNVCIMQLHKQKYELESQEYTIDTEFVFNKSAIIGADKDSDYNPKLLSEDYKEIRVCDNTENGFVYDLQKLNKNKIKLLTTEAFVPEYTKTYIRIKNEDGVYNSLCNNNLLGFVNNNVSTILLPTTATQSALANNKNFFNQMRTDREFEVKGDMLSIFTSALGIARSGSQDIVSAGLQGVERGLGYSLSLERRDINNNYTKDNLQNAPSRIDAAKGNVVFETMCSEYGVFVEEYDCLPHEKETANDYMVKYGFNTNLIGQITDYLNNSAENGRKYFNYIKAQIQNISGIPLSNTARTDIRQRFMNGVRFWNKTTNGFVVDYSKENYEKWLELPSNS